MENMGIWNAVSRPPKETLKQISGGRLRGMTDINPQWRLKILTEKFGGIGFGWKYNIIEHWNESHGDEVACFVRIHLFVKEINTWSEAIEGLGGSMILSHEKNGLYLSDEGYKMALTDALSVAMKQLGVAADVYAGLWDGSKYRLTEDDKKKDTPPTTTPPSDAKQEAQQAKKELGDHFDKKAAEQQPTKRPAPTAAERSVLNVLREYWLTLITSPSVKIDNEKVLDVLYSKLAHYPTLDECLKIKDETSPFYVKLDEITKVVA